MKFTVKGTGNDAVIKLDGQPLMGCRGFTLTAHGPDYPVMHLALFLDAADVEIETEVEVTK